LFSLDESDILNISGIGKKRSRAILKLLYELPFDYMDDSLPRNPEQDPYAGVAGKLTELLTNVYSQKLFKRGLDYFQRNKVGQIKLQDESTQTYQIGVQGTRPYTVMLKLDADDSAEVSCTCPAFTGYGYGYRECKHIWAAALALAEQQRLMRFEQIESKNYAYKQLVRRFKTTKTNSAQKSDQPLEYFLIRKQNQWSLYPKKIYPLMQSHNTSFSYLSRWNNPWNDLAPADPRDRLIISYLREIYMPDDQFYSYNSQKTDKSFGDALELLRDRPLYLKENKKQASPIHFREQPLSVQLNIDRSGDADSFASDDDMAETDLSLNFLLQNDEIKKNVNDVEVICLDPCWVLQGTTLTRVEGTKSARQFILNAPREAIRIPADEIESFLHDFYPALQNANIPVHMDEELTESKEVEPIPRLYLNEKGRRLEIELRAAYDDYEIQPDDQRTSLLLPVQQDEKENRSLLRSVHRNMQQEKRWIDELCETGLETNGFSGGYHPKDSALEWIMEYLPKLADGGYEIYGEQQLKRYARPKKLTSSSLSVKSGEQWFELEGDMTFGDTTISMRDIRSVLIHDKPYVQLNDGSTGELTEKWIRQFKKLRHLMSDDQQTRLPKIAAPAIAELGETVDEYTPDFNFEEYAGRLRKFENVEPVDAPEAFNGKLRPYQLAGLSWMRFLHQYGFGGILADDMGLGKTVQVLALLRKMQEESGTQPKALVIAPRSVLHNWQTETSRFTPDYSTYIHHGTDRIESPDEWPDATLSITTYATMRNDIEMISEKTFDYVVLDESHTIRNPSSKTFRAIRKLSADHRLCLTGTPVQNTTMDLWPQFEFLNPGLLGPQTRFRNEWVKPLEKKNNGEGEVGEMLHKMVAPFILRRTKQKVARDLPPLTSSRVDCNMDPAQQQTYEKYRQVYYQLVNESIDEKGVRDSRFTVLEGLTRLRQICCAPQLIEGETGGSAKLKHFTERAEELIQEGHRALVFSQFVGFLRRIEEEVKNHGWEYEYLDGQTRNRQERVDRFQSDNSKKLFLISLKAGGEGLNLTAADYVFLMDPWWNPAAERQAMDRTHRIGQEEHVFAYRFVCPGTVEEKILRLQEKKRNLAEKLIVAESGIFKQLERDDLLALFE
jgi:non-specific serine/threonine protein kinase